MDNSVLAKHYIYKVVFFNDSATTEIYTLSLHDALPIYYQVKVYKEGCIETSSCYYYSALGLEDNKNNKPFVIYPNPTRNILFIEGVNVKNIRILELSGKEVLVIKNMNQIDVSHLSKGLYLIEINNSEARLFSKL